VTAFLWERRKPGTDRDDAAIDSRLPPLPQATPWRHGVALWWLIAATESVNGSVRELVLAPWLGDAAAQRIGFASACVLIVAIATVFAPWMRATGAAAQLRIGALWALLTLAFEAGLAAAMGLSPADFLADYDPRRGGLMAFGMALLVVAPMLGAWLRRVASA
jgi:hypothetical protein